MGETAEKVGEEIEVTTVNTKKIKKEEIERRIENIEMNLASQEEEKAKLQEELAKLKGWLDLLATSKQ